MQYIPTTLQQREMERKRVTQLLSKRTYSASPTESPKPKVARREGISGRISPAQPSSAWHPLRTTRQPETDKAEVVSDDRVVAKRTLKPGSPWNSYRAIYEIYDFEVSIIHAVAQNGESVHIRRFTTSHGQQAIQRYLQLKQHQHANIVELIEVFNTPEHYFVILEEMKLCLFHISRSPKELSSIQLKSIMIQIIDALLYLETKQMVHGALSLTSILINSRGCIKLSNQENFKDYSGIEKQEDVMVLKRKDVIALKHILLILMEKDDQIQVVDRARWADLLEFEAALGQAKSISALQECTSSLGSVDKGSLSELFAIAEITVQRYYKLLV